MNVNLCGFLGNEIKDLIRLVKNETIRSTTISSFKMNEYNFSNNGQRINAYTLIPGLEESIILEFVSEDQENKIILINKRFYSEISYETFKTLKNRNDKLELYENKYNENDLLEALKCIPEEIVSLEQIFSILSVEPDLTPLNTTFEEYCHTINKMRNNQIEYIKTFNTNSIIKRSL